MAKVRKITLLTWFYIIWFRMRFMEMLRFFLSPFAQICIEMMGKSLSLFFSLSLFLKSESEKKRERERQREKERKRETTDNKN
jgi:hypothetical protein